jgi:acyl-CoA thioester hydrolase
MTISGFVVTCEVQPRFRDTDAMGHINNAVYVTYLEVARLEYWRRLTGPLARGRVPFILAQVRVDYRSEALVDDTLLVGIRCDRIGTKSFTFTYEIREQRSLRLVAEATSVQVCYDYEARRSVPVSDDLRRRVAALEGRAPGGAAGA